MSLVFTPEGTPASPQEGEVYYDSTADKLKVRDASGFREVVSKESSGGIDIKAVNGSTTHTFTVKGIGESIGDSQSGTSPNTTDSDSGQFAVYNGSTKLFGITEHGYVVKPNVPSFLYYGAPSKSGDIVYSFAHSDHNIGNHYNNSNGKFTAPISGRYLFCAGIWAVANTNEYMLIKVNNSELVGTHQAGDSDATGVSFSCIAELSAGDFVELHVRFSIQSSIPRNFFSGYLLG